MDILYRDFVEVWSCSEKTRRFAWLLLFCAGVILVGCTGGLPKGMAGSFPFLIALGAVLTALGERIGWIREYLGGGPIVVLLGSSLMLACGGIPDTLEVEVKEFMIEDGFLTLFIAALVTGSLLGMDRSLLLRSALGYIPILLAGTSLAVLLTGLAGALTGMGFWPAVFYVALPIMGGGMGAGAVPLAQIVANLQGLEPDVVLSRMVPSVVLGNFLAIMVASLLARLGRAYPSLSGEGQLMKPTASGQNPIEAPEDPKASLSLGDVSLGRVGTGLFLATSFYVLGHVLAGVIPLHPYALMILSVGVIKALGLLPRYLEDSAALWGEIMVLSLTPALLAGLGIVFTDLQQVWAMLSWSYLLLVLTTLSGAILGTAALGHWLGFYPVEAAVTGGLCMANMGGTGDVAVLSACQRLHLMPFAQVSSRIGGAMVLLLATALLGML